MRRALDAESSIRNVVETMPDFFRARLALVRSLEMQCRIGEAVNLVTDWLAGQPDSPDAWEYLAQIATRGGRFDQAIEAHQRLLSFHGENPRLWLEYAIALRFAGRQLDALQALRRSLELEPSYGPAWWTLATMAPEAIGAADMEVIEQALERAPNDPMARFLHNALATLLDRSGDYERAYRHFAASKAAGPATGYDPDGLERSTTDAIKRFDASFFADRGNFGAKTVAPIFIVGLPRSGSTLVERILGGHSKIEAAGELPILPSLIDQIESQTQKRSGYRELLPAISAARARELGELYLRRSQEFRATDKPFFTDKLHMNWLHLPLIGLILPNARIIDVRRDALDCCWSNFRTIFTSGHPAADDLGHIGRFYREYVRMADHAAGARPGRVLQVSYEAVVDDVEGETRRMLAFLGLEFEPACLEFHRLTSPVATQSAEQVRKPLNSEGIGRWKPYRQWLGPLSDALL